jgi:hypothetical protein
MPPESRTEPTRSAGLPWPFLPAFLPFWYVGIGWWWWRETREQLEAASAAAPSLDPAAMASLALGARVLGTLSEAGVYALWWKGRGSRLPYWRFLCWVASLSTADLLGFALRRAAADSPDLVRLLCAVLAGPAAVEPSPVADSGGVVAFGSLGVLTLLRVGMTGWAQARGTGRSLGGPLALTTAAWLVTRLAGWWSFDLLKGLSPVR